MTFHPRPRPGHPYLAGSPLLIAHRGGAKLAPENTLEAFESALVHWGADMLEMDVRATKDNVVVVIHDETVDRTCNGTGRVRELTWREIRALDAGYHFTDPDGVCSFRGRGVRVPRLEEVLEAFPNTRLNVEAKDPWSAEHLVRVVRRHGGEGRVLVAAEWERNRRSVRGYPGPWGASRKQLTLFFLLIHTPFSRFSAPACDVLQVPDRQWGLPVVSAVFLREAHRRNLPVHVWTVDEPEDMKRLLAQGVDGIQSDRPDLLAQVLTEYAGRPVAPAFRDTSGPSRPPAHSTGPKTQVGGQPSV